MYVTYCSIEETISRVMTKVFRRDSFCLDGLILIINIHLTSVMAYPVD